MGGANVSLTFPQQERWCLWETSSIAAMETVCTNRSQSWSKSLKIFDSFNQSVSCKYLAEAGTQWLFREGYSMFIGGYLKEIWTSEEVDIAGKATGALLIKALCFARMRKTEAPRQVVFKFERQSDSGEEITESHCTCKAGLGKCIHLAGLFHQLQHWIMMGFTEIPESTTCTSQEQQWHKPRGDQIQPDPVMSTIYARPRQNRKIEPQTCTFKSIGAAAPTSEKISKMTTRLKAYNADFPLAYLLTPNAAETLCQVPLGEVPLDSILAQQLKNYQPTSGYAPPSISASIVFPDLPMEILELPTEVNIFDGSKISLPDAIVLENLTRGQNSNLWHTARQIRLTASTYYLVCHRKKAVNEIFLKNLYFGKNISNLPGVSYGTKNESIARVEYVKVKNALGTPVTVFSSGFVVNPGMPFLGSSPDGKVYDPLETPNYGLLEIKCPISKKGKTLVEACSDTKFYGVLKDSKFHLSKGTEQFYQVQGQMYVCGVQWCDFVVFNGSDVWVERIRKDITFCNSMVNKLCKFQNEHFFNYVVRQKDLQDLV